MSQSTVPPRNWFSAACGPASGSVDSILIVPVVSGGCGAQREAVVDALNSFILVTNPFCDHVILRCSIWLRYSPVLSLIVSVQELNWESTNFFVAAFWVLQFFQCGNVVVGWMREYILLTMSCVESLLVSVSLPSNVVESETDRFLSGPFATFLRHGQPINWVPMQELGTNPG